MEAQHRTAGSRAAAGFVVVLLAIGSLVLWMVVPPLVLWALSMLIESSTVHFAVAIVAVPLAMVVFACGLFWLNGLYLRITELGHSGVRGQEEGWLTRRGPLELLLLWSLAIALLAMAVWFFVIAENPLLW